MPLVSLLTSAILDVHHDQANNWLYLDWKGPQKLADVQHAGQLLLALIAQTGTSKLLNDSTHVTYLPLKTVHWVAREFLPEVGRAGGEYMAWVSGRHLSCYNNIGLIVQPPGQHPYVVAFEDVAGACVWLNYLADAQSSELVPEPSANKARPVRQRYRQPAVPIGNPLIGRAP